MLKLAFLIFIWSCGTTDVKFLKEETRQVDIKEIEDDITNKFEVKESTSKQAKKEIEKSKKKSRADLSPKGDSAKESAKVEQAPSQKDAVKPKHPNDPSYGLWSKFSKDFVRLGEEHVINVTYMGINAASVLIKVKDKILNVGGKDTYAFYTRARTAKFYSWIYEVDDIVESFVTLDQFVPLKYTVAQRESSKTVDHVEIYDRQKLMTHFRYKRVKDDKKSYKKADEKIPFYSHDFLSCFFFIRGLPLKNGDVYKIPTTTKGKTWILGVEVEKREKITVPNMGQVNAIKLVATTRYEGELAKQGTMTFWMSADKYRKFLRVESELKIGSIVAELTEYKLD